MADTKCKHCDTGCKFCDARFMRQTPYAWFHYKDFTLIFHDVWEELIEGHNDWVPLYLEQQRTWVGLSDREKSNLWLESRAAIPRFHTYATLIEAKLKEKNNA